MRKQKDRCIVADAAGDVENHAIQSIKLRRQKDIYEDFAKAANSFTQYERTIVGGYGRSQGGKTAYVTRVYNKMNQLVGTTTSEGTEVKFITDHFVGRCIDRKITADNIKNALTNPLHVGIIKTDKKGRRSQEYIGAEARVQINPDTGGIVTLWATSTSIKRKYGVIP